MKKELFILTFPVLSLSFMTAQNTAYLTKVLEYCPAPGQFIHELPLYEEGDNAETMAAKCLENLYNERPVCLGAYGGYMTVGFDHTILNIAGQKDILIYGNANKYKTSAEPGIVMVSADTNQNGLPDDEWYELAGSEYKNKSTVHDYEITYTRPARENMDVTWTDNKGGSGIVKYMGIVSGEYNHTHAHYPKWAKSSTLTFKGARLPDNGAYDDEKGMWIMKPYDYGYADNLYSKDGCSFDLDWAIDSLGEKVHLAGIDFIRIYTAVNQQIGGGVGEISTEIADIQDLHPSATSIEKTGQLSYIYYQNGMMNIGYESPTKVSVYNLQGALIGQWNHPGHFVSTPLRLAAGSYLVQTGNYRQILIVDK